MSSGASCGGSSRPLSSSRASLQKHGDEVDRSRAADAHLPLPRRQCRRGSPCHSSARLTAPVMPGTPQLMPAPSNARARGPEPAQQDARHSHFPAPFSPFVPISRNSRNSGCAKSRSASGSRRDIAADIARDARGKSHGKCPKSTVTPRRLQTASPAETARAGDGRDLAPVEKVLHHGIARNDELLDLLRLPSGGGKCLSQKCLGLRADTARQLAEPVGRLHRVLDAADNVTSAVGRLRVPVLSLREQLSVCAVRRAAAATVVVPRPTAAPRARAARLRLRQCERVRLDGAPRIVSGRSIQSPSCAFVLQARRGTPFTPSRGICRGGPCRRRLRGWNIPPAAARRAASPLLRTGPA